jgi:dephospho-CoA kinase
VRAERAGRRGHSALAERTGRQLSQEEKSQRADFTVRNDGTIEELKQMLSNVLGKIERTPWHT